MRINRHFEFLKDNTERFTILKGGAGSGKSYSMAQHVFLSLLNKNKKENWLILRKVANTVKYSTFSLLKGIINKNKAEGFFNINKSDKSFECVSGNKAIMVGLDDPEKIKSIYDMDKIWMEEASEFSKDDFLQLSLRLRGEGEKKQYFLSFNPIDQDHWIKDYFFDNKKPDVRLDHSTYRHNKFLDAEYTRELKRLKEIDEYYYQVYCLGEWGVISEARVFHNLKVHEFDYDESNLENVRYGMDFGFVNASSLISTGYRDNSLYIFDELYYRELTNTELISKVDDSGFDKNNVIIADSAEPDRIKEFRQAGYDISGSKKGKGSLRNGIDYLKNFTIHIHSKKCPNAVKEFQEFKQRELKDGTITEDFVELNDHTIAGVRYGNEDLWVQHIVLAPSIIKHGNRPKLRSKVMDLPT